MSKIVPAILAGGSGSPPWPFSRLPKPPSPLAGERTPLQQAALKVSDPACFDRPMVIGDVEHRFLLAEQLRQIDGPRPLLVLEPAARNTAAAVAVAAALAFERDPEAIVLIMPADHVVSDLDALLAALDRGLAAAARGDLVLFGVEPTHPAPRCGYVLVGEPKGEARRVRGFVEAPDPAAAEDYMGSGEHLWNAGVFLFPARRVMAELERHAPDILAAAQDALARAVCDTDFLRLDAEAFLRCPAASIEEVVLARTDRAVVVALDGGWVWSDVASWSALWRLGVQDEDENVVVGEVQAHATEGSYLRSEGPAVMTVGVRDLIVVATPDAVLVAGRDHAPKGGAAVGGPSSASRSPAIQPPRRHRPWGWYENLLTDERFQVKRLVVQPGQSLSLQRHVHRGEHWVVVQGAAQVVLGETESLLTENESVYIPPGAVHRLTNPGRTLLILIEVQFGSYLGEDDIVRFDDMYARR